MKILILGSSGLLGKDIYKVLNKHYAVSHSGLAKRNCNFEKLNEIKKVLLYDYDLIINCIAITDIEYCETNKKQSKKINEDLLKKIFLLKKNYKLRFNFIHFSTDQMYNNKNSNSELSKPIIFNEYTKQKLNSEKICKKNKALVFRINFINQNKNNFFGWLIKQSILKKKIYLFNDIEFNPLRSKTISKIILKIIKKKKYKINGLFNLGSKGKITKAEFGIKVFRYLKKKINYDICSSKHLFKTKRPNYMSMRLNKFSKFFNIKLPSIESEIINEIKNYKNR